MDETPREPVERTESVERRTTVERETTAPSAEPAERRTSFAWLWVVILLAVVGFLAWYALSRGEPQQVEVPELELPAVEAPSDEPDVQINVEDATPEAAPEP